MTDFLSMTPEELAKDLMGAGTTATATDKDTAQGNDKENVPDGDAPKADEEKDTNSPPPQGGGGGGGDTTQTLQSPVIPAFTTPQPNAEASTDPLEKPLDMDEVKNVSADAFKDAYDYYKKNAVGDPKTREKYLGQLRNELADYEEDESGNKTIKGGILKNFTDDNYQNALNAGETIINNTLKQLSAARYPSFEAFSAAREKAAASLHSQLQSNVAYPELAKKFMKSLEDLSNKKVLEFNLSDTEREKEKMIMEQSKKNVEQQEKSHETQAAVNNSQQYQTNLETERKLLKEQNEKQAREWKARMELESQLRRQQIEKELNAGFEERYKRLQEEMAASTNQQMAMMMQMQKDSMEQQAKLTQMLTLEMNRQPPPPPPPKPAGLLTTLLTPVANLLGNLL